MGIFVWIAQLLLVSAFVFLGIGTLGQLMIGDSGEFLKLGGLILLMTAAFVSCGVVIFEVIPIVFHRLIVKKS